MPPELRPGQRVPPAAEEQVGFKAGTEEESDRAGEGKRCRKPRRRPQRSFIRAAKAARLLKETGEEEEEQERGGVRKRQEEEEKENENQVEKKAEGIRRENERKAAEEGDGTPTSSVLMQAYPSASIKKEVEENHGLMA